MIKISMNMDDESRKYFNGKFGKIYKGFRDIDGNIGAGFLIVSLFLGIQTCNSCKQTNNLREINSKLEQISSEEAVQENKIPDSSYVIGNYQGAVKVNYKKDSIN